MSRVDAHFPLHSGFSLRGEESPMFMGLCNSFVNDIGGSCNDLTGVVNDILHPVNGRKQSFHAAARRFRPPQSRLKPPHHRGLCAPRAFRHLAILFRLQRTNYLYECASLRTQTNFVSPLASATGESATETGHR